MQEPYKLFSIENGAQARKYLDTAAIWVVLWQRVVY